MTAPNATIHNGTGGGDVVSEVDPTTEAARNSGETRVEGLPENFKTVDDLVKSHKDQQAEITRLQQAAKGEQKPESTTETPAEGSPTTTEQATKAVEDAGLDMVQLSQEYAKDGKLSDATYKALEDKGHSREVVDRFIEGQNALNEKNALEIYSVVGGEETFKLIDKWASEGNLEASELEAYAAAAQSGNVALTKMVLEGIYAKYKNAVGSPGQHVQGGVAGGQTDVYESKEQLLQDQMTDKYQRDPAERDRVFKKLMRSKI